MDTPAWHPRLYRGAAPHYVRGRVGYPDALVGQLVARLPLRGDERLLDLGCGPGSLTLPLAPFVATALGVDADAGMLAVAAHQAALAGPGNTSWLRCRAEQLPPELVDFDVVTLAQSFHWMDRPLVAALTHERLRPGGALVHVHAATHRGLGDDGLPHPRPPWTAIDDLVQAFLPAAPTGAPRTPQDHPGSVETPIYQAAGFAGPERFTVTGEVVDRTADEVLSSVLSLSSSTPHLFGDRLGAFEQRLRHLLHETSPTGRFSERMPDVTADIWRR